MKTSGICLMALGNYIFLDNCLGVLSKFIGLFASAIKVIRANLHFYLRFLKMKNVKMTVLLITIGIIVIVPTIWLVVENRASEKILNSFFSALIIGFSGALLSIFFSLKSEVVTGKFSTLLFFTESPMKLIDIDKYIAESEYHAIKPLYFTFYDDVNTVLEGKQESSAKINKELFVTQILVRKIFEIIGYNFDKFWLREIMLIETPHSYFNLRHPIDKELTSKQIDWIDLRNIFPLNPFLNNKIKHSNLTFPLDTKISINHLDRKSVLIFETKFVKIKLDFISGIIVGGSGFGNQLDRLIVKQKPKDFGRTTTIPALINYEIIFNGMKIGHPEMANQKKWAKDIIQTLETTLDSKVFWKSVSRSLQILENGEITKSTNTLR